MKKRFHFFVTSTVALLFGVLLGSGACAESQYVGAVACQGCHQAEFQQWQLSDHAKSMQQITEETVLGDFSNVTVSFHNMANRFYQKDKTYWIETSDQKGVQRSFEIKYSFGFYPLQQYLVETENGHLQALNIAWDSRKKSAGGQRWFHLQPNEKITQENPFFWTRHFQNWNSRCADCHSTNVDKNYSPENNSYATHWSEINVACEACHGPASEHVAMAKQGTFPATGKGLLVKADNRLEWQFVADSNIAHAQGEQSSNDIDMCGRCHSLRTPLKTHQPGDDFHGGNRLHLLDSTTYFYDGQVQEEAFVLGSFLQSKMFAKGVTCSNCHNAHSGKVLMEGNGLCSQCHNPQVFDNTSHHHHSPSSEGAACVNCHMPARTFMQVDARRDHSFGIPRPDLSISLGVPNACTGCHAKEKGRDASWANEQLASWGVLQKDHWAALNRRADTGDVLVTRELVRAIDAPALRSITRASLLQQFDSMPSRVSAEAAQKQLQSNYPLLRRGAVRSLRGLPSEVRWQLLAPHMKDDNRSVRFEIAATLADSFNVLAGERKKALATLIAEYRQMLAISADSPVTQLAIAELEINLGNLQAAGNAYQQALRIAPNYVPALINFADYHRVVGQEEKSAPLYKKALQVAPDSGSAQHSYGLFLIRQQKYSEALPHLAKAIVQRDAQPRYAFVYAVALDSEEQTEQAVSVLEAAVTRWPNQFELLMTLIQYLEKTGRKNDIYPYLSSLTAIAPNSPDVKRLVDQYSH